MSHLMAQDASNATIYAPKGKAIKGFDPVAYFTASKPMMGKVIYSYDWMGATWQFTSNENMEAFKQDPEKYAPQFGGYCAYGVADGHKAPTQADAWTIVDGKLYLNYNDKVKELWDKNQKKNIEKAEKLWPTVQLEK